jgi:hypothetical protein
MHIIPKLSKQAVSTIELGNSHGHRQRLVSHTSHPPPVIMPYIRDTYCACRQMHNIFPNRPMLKLPITSNCGRCGTYCSRASHAHLLVTVASHISSNGSYSYIQSSMTYCQSIIALRRSHLLAATSQRWRRAAPSANKPLLQESCEAMHAGWQDTAVLRLQPDGL